MSKRHSRRSGGHRPGRSHRGNERSTFSAVSIIAGLVLFVTGIAGGGIYYALQTMGLEKLDTAYCYQREDQFTVALWVDFSHTQRGSDSQTRDLINLTNREYRNLPPNGKLYVYTSASDAAATIVEPAFVICRPAKNGREQKKLSAPETLSTILARQYTDAEELFAKKLNELARDAKDPAKAAKSSPILAQIRGISQFDYDAPLSKVAIFTDGINNSSIGHFCVDKNAMPPFKAFSKRPDYDLIKPDDLTGVTVDFYLVEFGKLPSSILPYCTNQELYDFYLKLFEDAGASSVRIKPLGVGAG